MEAQEYQNKRDELLGLMKSIVNVEGLLDNEKEFFLTTQRKLVENQFNIVLIGEFQGGKSTTFNAMCGGREISPRGAMTKTSAVCITATNISDSNEPEYAKVRWKTDNELRETISEVLKYVPLPKDGDERPVFDFKNNDHMQALSDEVIELSNPSNLNHLSDEEKDILRIAYLLLAFYDATELNSKLEKEKFKVSEIAKIAVFPNEWEEKWLNVNNIDDVRIQFKIDDALFAFVSDIQVYIHSDNLARLGCSITDCPGLFASQFDTQVALNAMSRANAVIYLLGSKQIGTEDKKSIHEVMRHEPLRDKVFFALNRKDRHSVIQNVLNTDKSIISQMGYGNVEIVDFNALLFFLSEFANSNSLNKLDDYSLKRFVDVAKNNGFTDQQNDDNNLDNIWSEIVRNCGFTTGDKDAQLVTELNNDSIKTAKDASNCESVIGGIESDIVKKKAKSILVDSGAAVIERSLNGIASRLQTEEDMANKSVGECRTLYENASQAYEQFVADVNTILDTALPDSLINDIANIAYSNLITDNNAINRFATKINSKIRSDLGFFQRLSFIGKSDEEKKEILNPIIENAITSELGNDINIWVNAMIKGEDPMYQRYIQPQLTIVAENINAKWQLCVNNNPLLNGFAPNSTPTGTNSIHIEDDPKLIAQIVGSTTTQIVTDIAAYASIVIGSTVIVTFVDGILTCGLLTLVATIIAGLGGGRMERNSERKIAQKISESLEDKKEVIINELSKCPECIIRPFKQFYNNELSSIRERLDTDMNARLQEQNVSIERQREIAERANRIRTEEIEPLKEKVSDFIASCNF